MKTQKLLYIVILTAMVSLLGGVSTAQQVPSLKQNMPYAKARKLLIASGWKPVLNKEQINNPSRIAPVNYFVTIKKYTEIVDCAGSGLGLCLFKFENSKGKKLLVTTANNGANKETVYGWEIEKSQKPLTKINISCAPLSNTSRILKSPNPNDIHPDWKGESYIGTSWSFIGNNIIKNDTETYLKGDLYSPRGGVVNKNVFILKNEWECNPN